MKFACKTCHKKFRSEGALEMHNNSKHRSQVQVVTRARKPLRRFIPVIVACLVGVMIGSVATLYVGGNLDRGIAWLSALKKNG